MKDVKNSARVALNYAVNNGKLKRLPCEVCGDPKSDGHHPNYSMPLEVNWLCRKHHSKLHWGMRRAERIKAAQKGNQSCVDILLKDEFTAEELPKYIQAISFKYGSQGEFAKAMYISPSLLSDMIVGRRRPSDKFLAKIGLERVITYVSIINTLPPCEPDKRSAS